MFTGLEFSSSLIATYSKEERESRKGEVEESQGALKGTGEAWSIWDATSHPRASCVVEMNSFGHFPGSALP